MKKIAIGIAVLFSLLPTLSLAVNASSKNEVSVPCYNGGYAFGLAGYVISPAAPLDSKSSNNAPTLKNEMLSHQIVSS